jgi:hypothetical protein
MRAYLTNKAVTGFTLNEFGIPICLEFLLYIGIVKNLKSKILRCVRAFDSIKK